MPLPGLHSSDPRNRRLRPGLKLELERGTVVVDTSPDFREQSLRFGIERVDAVLYTHPHADHVFGLDDLRPFNFRQKSTIPCYGSASTLARLRQIFAYVFEAGEEGGGKPRIELVEVDAPFELLGETVVPIPVAHGSMPVLGWRIGPFAVVTDVHFIPEASFALLAGVEFLVLSALRYRRTRPTSTSTRRSRRRRASARAAPLFTHIAHDVEHGGARARPPAGRRARTSTGSCWRSAERVTLRRAGWPPAVGKGKGGRSAHPPGSKSLTHRAYALALLCRQPVEIVRPLDAEDTRLFAAALTKLGFRVEHRGESVHVAPSGRDPGRAAIDCGNAGTLFRFLVALLATQPGEWTLDGTPRLRERPVGPLADALAELGAEIEWRGAPGHAPLVVRGGSLAGGRARLDAGESSQYLSALLLAGQRAPAPIEIEVAALVSAPYVDLTVDLILAHGGVVERPQPGLWRTEPSVIAGGRIEIEADLSAAAYPAAAAALAGGGILIRGVRLDSRQGDRRFLDLLREMGARVEPALGGVRVDRGELAALDVDLSDIPDQVPTLAALAPFARGHDGDPQRRAPAAQGERPPRGDGRGAPPRRGDGRGAPRRSRHPRSLGRRVAAGRSGHASTPTTTTASRWRWRSSASGVRICRSRTPRS